MIFKGQESTFNNNDMISVFFFLSLAKIKNNYILIKGSNAVKLFELKELL